MDTRHLWGWRRWEKEIDWMAVHGINMLLLGVNKPWIPDTEPFKHPVEKAFDLVEKYKSVQDQ